MLDQFSAPAYFLLVLAAVAIALLKNVFNDIIFDGVHKAESIRKAKISSIDLESLNRIDNYPSHVDSTGCCGLSLVDCAVFGCMLLSVTTKGSIACFDTLGMDIAVDSFHLTPSHAGDVFAASGLMGSVVLFLYGFLSTYLSDIQVIVGGIATIAVSILSLVAFGSTSDDEMSHDRLFLVTMFVIYAVGYPLGDTAIMGLFSKCTFNVELIPSFPYFL